MSVKNTPDESLVVLQSNVPFNLYIPISSKLKTSGITFN